MLTFDCYGTLIDWESGIIEALKPLTRKAGNGLTRDRILEAHARHESAQQRYTPALRYSELLAVVYKRLAEEWGVAPSWRGCVAYGQSVKDWPAFADSAAALRYLKKHYKLVILSNVDNRSFAHSARKLKVEFDAVFTAEDIGSYKPSPRNFQYLLEKLAGLGIAKDDILHTAESLFHDHAPANDVGLASCWIWRRYDRQGFGATLTPERTPRHDFRFNSMSDMVKAHRGRVDR
ncbi:MAG: haloacid dehalogenase type II [Pseudomonadota bacterium]|nr:haloacid dehalogenase type II [Pseudomonadota bacterium]